MHCPTRSRLTTPKYSPQAHRRYFADSEPPAGRSRWAFWLAVTLIILSSLACRIEFGVGQEVSAQNDVSVPAPVLTNQIGVNPAQSQPGAGHEPASGEAPAAASASIATPTLRLTPTPGPTATPAPSPTPTIAPFVPARFPPTQIQAPAIGMDVPVLTTSWTVSAQNNAQTSIWSVPDAAAGWHQNSALPGHNSNVVLSGHHNRGGEVFRYLVDLQLGDEIILAADNYTYHYTVTDRFIVPERGVPDEQRQQNVQWIMPTVDERLTLVTCWPYTDNSHRLIVVAKPVSITG